MVVIPVVAPAPRCFTDGGGRRRAEDQLAETPLPFPKPRVLVRTQLRAAHQVEIVTVALALLTKFVEVARRLALSTPRRKRAQALAAAERADAEERARAFGRLLRVGLS